MCMTLNSRDRRGACETGRMPLLRNSGTVIRPPETTVCLGIEYFIILHDLGSSRSPTLSKGSWAPRALTKYWCDPHSLNIFLLPY
jgi:hypothetical protein